LGLRDRGGSEGAALPDIQDVFVEGHSRHIVGVTNIVTGVLNIAISMVVPDIAIIARGTNIPLVVNKLSLVKQQDPKGDMLANPTNFSTPR